MGSDDPPTLRRANPTVTLTSNPCRRLPGEFCVGSGEIASKCRDDGVAQRAVKTLRRARLAEFENTRVPIEVFGSTIANDLLTLPKEGIKRRYIICYKGCLIAHEGFSHFGDDFRQIYFHMTNISFLGSARGQMMMPTLFLMDHTTDRVRASPLQFDARAFGVQSR
jgi:hypothetical protein